VSGSGPECVKTRNFLDSGGASPLAYTEIVAYTRSSEAKFLDPNFIRSFHTASAGLRHVRFHDLRHTYASELAEQGAPPKYVQSQLGHSSIQVTMDIYSHFFEKRNREWVNTLDETTEEMNGYYDVGGESATPTQPNLVREEHQTHKFWKNMVAVEGLEPPARGL